MVVFYSRIPSDIPKKAVLQKNEWSGLKVKKVSGHTKDRCIQNKLQGNTTATEPARPKFSAEANPTKDPEIGQNLPLGGQGEPEAPKNTPSPSVSGDSKRNHH